MKARFKNKKGKEASNYDITDYPTYLEKARNQFLKNWRKSHSSKCSLEDFDLLKTLGSGSFGTVILVRLKANETFHAIKVLDKAAIVKQKQIDHVLNEKLILDAIKFTFIVYLEYCFKDNKHIYFVMPFIIGGEMFIHLRKMKKFDEYLSRFYAAQVVLALEYLHYLDLVYRDLKPENILIDQYGYLKVTDLGFCKYVPGRTWTLCGTPEYIAPEIILSKGYGKSVDWWSFGVLVFEMTAGYPPFNSRDPIRLYEKIVSGKYHNAPHFSNEVKDLIRNLLQVDLSRRYGNLKNGVNDIKDHKWFRSIDWLIIVNRKILPPYVPEFNSDLDLSYFDTKEEKGENVIIRDDSVDEFVDEFADF